MEQKPTHADGKRKHYVEEEESDPYPKHDHYKTQQLSALAVFIRVASARWMRALARGSL
jgi:hypothetical protein